MSSAVPFRYAEHLLVVPVMVDGVETSFILDTGIGVNLISPGLAAKVSCLPLGESYTGRRMSGQQVPLPMSTLGSLKMGDYARTDVPVGVFDLSLGLEGIEGFVSLTNFRSAPVTIDYEAGVIVIEDERSLAGRVASGTSVAIRVREDGPYSTDVHVDLTLPGRGSVSVEVDTGSDNFILNQPFAAPSGVDLGAEGIRKLSEQDETGHEYARYFTACQETSA